MSEYLKSGPSRSNIRVQIGMLLSVLRQSKQGMNPSKSCRKSQEHAVKRPPVRDFKCFSFSVSTKMEAQFTPAGWSPAARWLGCASAPPWCPCFSDSRSSAAKHLPASGSQRIPPLFRGEMQRRRVSKVNRGTS